MVVAWLVDTVKLFYRCFPCYGPGMYPAELGHDTWMAWDSSGYEDVLITWTRAYASNCGGYGAASLSD